MVFVGTKDTSNPLADEQQYQHVTLTGNLAPGTLDLMRRVQNAEIEMQEKAVADCIISCALIIILISWVGLDGLVVAFDAIIRHCTNAKGVQLKFEKRVYLITDGEASINQTGLSDIAQAALANAIQLLIVNANEQGQQTGSVWMNTHEFRHSHSCIIPI